MSWREHINPTELKSSTPVTFKISTAKILWPALTALHHRLMSLVLDLIKIAHSSVRRDRI
jgi:hypothetical protein